uniref:Uncharacterized protein n=1 Tax=Parascaris univalens TaxID=6257 RepID=A0A915C3M8_PARUN
MHLSTHEACHASKESNEIATSLRSSLRNLSFFSFFCDVLSQWDIMATARSWQFMRVRLLQRLSLVGN